MPIVSFFQRLTFLFLVEVIIQPRLNKLSPTAYGRLMYAHVLWGSCYSVRNVNVLRSFLLVSVTLRWLDWIFWGGYLSSLSINYVTMIKDMEQRLPQLYYIKMKISYDLGFIAIGVAMATYRRHYVFYLSLCFSVPGGFLRNRLREYVPAIIVSIIVKFEQILCGVFEIF